VRHPLIVRMNELARRYRDNKAEIDNPRWQLSVVRRASQKSENTRLLCHDVSIHGL
jgi:hypothetical protein